MIQHDYSHKPLKIETPRDLLAFIKPIPAAHWCVDTREDEKGRRCILGHLEEAYAEFRSIMNGNDVFKWMPRNKYLAFINNGRNGLSGPRYGKTTGSAIKRRLIEFLESLPD